MYNNQRGIMYGIVNMIKLLLYKPYWACKLLYVFLLNLVHFHT